MPPQVDQSRQIPQIIETWILSLADKPTGQIKTIDFRVFQETGNGKNYGIRIAGSDCLPENRIIFPDTNGMDWEAVLEIVKNGILSFIGSDLYGKSKIYNAESIMFGFDDIERQAIH